MKLKIVMVAIRQTLVPIVEASDISQPLTRAVIIVGRLSFRYERLQRYTPPFIKIQTISTI